VFISVRGDHARERESADPLFGPIPARELEGGLPKARTRRRRNAIFGHVEAWYLFYDTGKTQIRWAITLAPMQIVSRHFAHVL
jgi:hypothetical protein